MNKYAQYFAIEKNIKAMSFDVDRADLIDEFTDGQTKSLRDLSDWQYQEFIRWLRPIVDNLRSETKKDWQNSPENRMRRKIIALFVHRMDYTMESLDGWCVKYGQFHKPLNDHTLPELTRLVTQCQNVYDSFIKSTT